VVSSFRAGGAQYPYFVVTFGGVRMLSYKISMSSPLPTEDIDFAFGQCQFEYSPQSATGESLSPVSYAWDFVQRETWQDAPRKLISKR
jgi:type VI protein secretion system component Hcp